RGSCRFRDNFGVSLAARPRARRLEGMWRVEFLQLAPADPSRSAAERPAVEVVPTDLAEIFEEYRAGYGQPRDAAATAEFLQTALSAGRWTIIGALQEQPTGGQRILGFLSAEGSLSTVSRSSVCVVKDLYVRPDRRRQGVARALLQF